VPGSLSNSTRVAWVLLAALLVFVAWLAVPGSSHAGIAFFYTVPVGLAAWWWGGRAAGLAVAACVFLYLIGAAIEPVDRFGLALAVRAAVLVAVAVLVTLLRERLAVLEHSADELEAIRAALAPSELPQLPGVEAAAAFVPSEYGVSGDFYLLTNGPDGSAIAIVGDVVGHGPKAARLATFLRARFAAFAASTSDPAELLMLANGALADRPGGELVTAACLRYLVGERRISWATAGHPPPLRLPSLEELHPGDHAFPLGAEAPLALDNFDAELASGEGVILYTDGATDVRRERSRLGLDGLSHLLAPLTSLPVRQLASRAEQELLAWTDERIRDDLCLLVLRSEDGAAA
jgi:serine phosphatase RsbU (regulator of sigma subunit)